MELVASEPLIREPSGVCWDEQGRLFVCELHGFNVDGQIDIDELNKTGKTIVMVTHEQDIAAWARRVVRLRDGIVESDVTNPSPFGYR